MHILLQRPSALRSPSAAEKNIQAAKEEDPRKGDPAEAMGADTLTGMSHAAPSPANPSFPFGIQRKQRPQKPFHLYANSIIQRKGDEPDEKPKLLTDFAKDFADAAALIEKSESAMKLVKEAQDTGAEYGGYAEDGPGASTWPYTVGNKVYIPKAHTDAYIAMSDFVFELNNAIHQPKFDKLFEEAAKGSTGSLDAKTYAYKIVELEVEGVIRTGEIWFETKTSLGNKTELDAYDATFYLEEYKDYKDKKKTKEDMIKDMLQRVYPEGKSKGKTVEQNYMEQYNRLSGGK